MHAPVMAGCREKLTNEALMVLPAVVSTTHSQLVFAQYEYGKPGLEIKPENSVRRVLQTADPTITATANQDLNSGDLLSEIAPHRLATEFRPDPPRELNFQK